MSTDDASLSAESGVSAESAADGMNDQLHQLEAFVARAEAAGDELPPEAAEMVEKLREIIHALEGLTSSLDVSGESITLDEVSSPPPEDA